MAEATCPGSHTIMSSPYHAWNSIRELAYPSRTDRESLRTCSQIPREFPRIRVRTQLYESSSKYDGCAGTGARQQAAGRARALEWRGFRRSIVG